MDLGLVGRANAGKTALFALVTGVDAEIAPYPFTTREPAPRDGRRARPAPAGDRRRAGHPARVPAQVQLVDIAGLAAGAGQGEGLGGAALGQLRQADALVHVVRAFANAEVPHPEDRVDPVADAEAVDLELAIADRDQVERRLERVRKGARAGEKGAVAELAALERWWPSSTPAAPPASVGDEAAHAIAADMGLLTAKPVLYIANTDEELEPPEGLAAHAAAQGAQALALPVGMELELAAMDPDEAAEFAARDGAGRHARRRRGRGRAPTACSTWSPSSPAPGPPEARAWPIPRGTTAARRRRQDPLRPGARLHPRRGRSAGRTSSPPARGARPARPRSCAWRARTTSCRRAT